jgi:hypothetical protein
MALDELAEIRDRLAHRAGDVRSFLLAEDFIEAETQLLGFLSCRPPFFGGEASVFDGATFGFRARNAVAHA